MSKLEQVFLHHRIGLIGIYAGKKKARRELYEKCTDAGGGDAQTRNKNNEILGGSSAVGTEIICVPIGPFAGA